MVAAAQAADNDGELAVKKILLFLALGFALFAAPAAVTQNCSFNDSIANL